MSATTTGVNHVKLEDPGSGLEMTVEYATPEKRGEYDYWLIGGNGAETLVPKKSIEPQLDRVGVASVPELIGHRIRISRSATLNKYNKPYWNLDGARDMDTTPMSKRVSVPPKPAVMASKPNAELPPLLQNQEEEDAAELSARVGVDLGKFSKDLALYTALTEFVTKDIAPIHVKGGIGMSPESAVAAVATLYIQAKKAS